MFTSKKWKIKVKAKHPYFTSTSFYNYIADKPINAWEAIARFEKEQDGKIIIRPVTTRQRNIVKVIGSMANIVEVQGAHAF